MFRGKNFAFGVLLVWIFLYLAFLNFNRLPVRSTEETCESLLKTCLFPSKATICWEQDKKRIQIGVYQRTKHKAIFSCEVDQSVGNGGNGGDFKSTARISAKKSTNLRCLGGVLSTTSSTMSNGSSLLFCSKIFSSFRSCYQINISCADSIGEKQFLHTLLLRLFDSSTRRDGNTLAVKASVSSNLFLEDVKVLEKSSLEIVNPILLRTIHDCKNINSVRFAATWLSPSKHIGLCMYELGKVLFSQETDLVVFAIGLGFVALFFTSLQVVLVSTRRQFSEANTMESNKGQEGPKLLTKIKHETKDSSLSLDTDKKKKKKYTIQPRTGENKRNEKSPDIGKGLLLELESVLGQGKNAKVYKGTYFGKTVAVKVSERVGSKKQAVHEPLEIKLLRHLRHPNILGFITSVKLVPPQDTSVASMQPISDSHKIKVSYQTFAVVEYCDRGNLYEKIKQYRRRVTDFIKESNGISTECAIRCAIDISRAMELVHSRRVVHRALHPKNILLKADATDPRGFICKLGGFGSSYRLSPGSTSIQDNKMKSFCIAAPEVLSNGQLSLASDVYAFGVLFYSLFTNRMPFQALTNNEIRRTVLAGNRPSIPEFVPARIAELIKSCWAHNPQDRPSFTKISCQLEEMMRSTRMFIGAERPLMTKERVENIPPQSTGNFEKLVPGNSYIHIQVQSAPVDRPESTKRREYRPRHCRSLSDASCQRRRSARSVVKQRSSSMLPESNEEAFVRSVDDIIRRSRTSGSKMELRQFLSRITLDCDCRNSTNLVSSMSTTTDSTTSTE